MTAANVDFEIEQGATFSQQLVWKDSLGAPINLTGYTARMQIRRSVSSADILTTLTTENGGITLGGALGTITLTMTEAQTAALTKSGVYDLELVASNAFVTRLIEGSVTLSKEVTR